MTLRFDFFYENANEKYFLALLQKLANACEVDLRAESSAEILSVFASAESAKILGKFADFLQVEVPHSLYFKLKNAELCNEVRGEKIALDLDGIFSVSEINAIKDINSPQDSAESQNLNQNNSVRSTQTRPLRGAKKRKEGCSSATADFLLEADKRGTPPKSEKAAAFWRVGGAGRGVQPFLRKEKNEIDGNGFTESARDSSPTAQNDNFSGNFAESSADSADLKSTLQNICTSLKSGQSVAFATSRGEILLSTKNEDFDFILAGDIATINLYTRASQDEISVLASFEKPLIKLAIKEVFVREVGAKCAKFILPFDIALCCLSSMLLAQNIAFVRGRFAESCAERHPKSSKFFEIVVGQNGYFLHKNYLDSADFAEFWNMNFGAQSCAKNSVIASEQGERGNPQNIIIYLSLQNHSIFACGGEKIINIAFDKNPKNILQKITNLENGDKLIANFKKAFEARYEAIFAQDCAPQWTQNLLDIFECAAMILGCECDKSAIFDLASGYLRDIGPKIDFKNRAGDNSPLGLHSADFANLGRFADFSPVSHPKFAKNHESQTENPSVVDSANLSNSQNLGENQMKNTESSADSAESQNLNQNNRAQSAHLESRPLRGAKNRIQGCSSATADFLLEAEKRGSPPKSEKRQLLARRGSGVGGAALLRKEKDSNESAESNRDSSVASLPQNDKIMDYNADSANLLAMTENNNFAESSLDSAFLQEANSSIVDEFLRSCEVSDADRTNGSSRKRGEREREKSPQDAEFALYDELKTIRSIISFTLAGTEREVVAFGILESLVDYLVLLFREAQNQFGAKNICIAGDMFANKVFFDKITKKIPADFKLIFPKYLDISSARRASCKT